ncbi:MAG: sodium-dependent transporter [Muribaculaceae bacterium]
MSNRAQFVTKTGIIAATVGSAVGLGNIWRFPYEAGVHGGGAFLILYIICVLFVGIPVVVAEFVLGRGTHSNAKGSISKLRKGSFMRWFPLLGVLASVLILGFYSVVAGWILQYLYQSVTGALSNHTPQEYGEIFGKFVSNPWLSVMCTLIFLGINYMVLIRGVQKGIERMANILMPLLFVILIVFCVNSLMLDNASEGLRFLFSPDFSQITPSVVIGAMGQAFFSLSVGLGCLLTYASYFSDKTPLVKNATTIALLDTLVAILAGIMIFPAVFSFGMSAEAGPKLVFEILPSIFQQLPFGYVWSLAFFVLLFFASLTSTISMSETCILCFIEELKMSRKAATIANTIICMFLGVICSLSFGVMSDVKVFGMTFFELFDFVSSSILLPVGGIFFSVFVGWFVNNKFLDAQLTSNGNGKMSKWVKVPMMFCIRFVAPISIVLIFLYGLGLLEFLL